MHLQRGKKIAIFLKLCIFFTRCTPCKVCHHLLTREVVQILNSCINLDRQTDPSTSSHAAQHLFRHHNPVFETRENIEALMLIGPKRKSEHLRHSPTGNLAKLSSRASVIPSEKKGVNGEPTSSSGIKGRKILGVQTCLLRSPNSNPSTAFMAAILARQRPPFHSRREEGEGTPILR